MNWVGVYVAATGSISVIDAALNTVVNPITRQLGWTLDNQRCLLILRETTLFNLRKADSSLWVFSSRYKKLEDDRLNVLIWLIRVLLCLASSCSRACSCSTLGVFLPDLAAENFAAP